jgi:serine phosphatase RsbU (regulator of sigma subunit)
MFSRSRSWLYTFSAVFVAVLTVTALAVPVAIAHAERLYFRLQADVNERHAAAMARFVSGRLAGGAGPEQAVAEFQIAIDGSQIDRGYVCLIDRGSTRYLSHPNHAALGMPVKPMALFDPGFSLGPPVPFRERLAAVEAEAGLLSPGPGMTNEIVSFRSVPGTRWTVSSHENTSRIQSELRALRIGLIGWGAVLGLAIAVPASVAARRVSQRFEREIQSRASLERRLLEAEDARKTRELEAARAIQVSMLPQTLPDYPTLRLGACLVTASEVGGDYYDVDLHEQVLTVVVADVTGHGLRAGMMTAVAKSLFTHSARDADLEGLMGHTSGTLERMALPGGMAIALGLLRVRDYAVEIVGAGLPAALHYRIANGRVETIPLDGFPLGFALPMDAPYSHRRLTAEPGDTIVLMTDGLIELFNDVDEMFGVRQAAHVLAQVADQPPDAVARALHQAGLAWANGRPPDDDLTIVVLQFRPLGA